jgi:hypothetical protein
MRGFQQRTEVGAVLRLIEETTPGTLLPALLPRLRSRGLCWLPTDAATCAADHLGSQSIFASAVNRCRLACWQQFCEFRVFLAAHYDCRQHTDSILENRDLSSAHFNVGNNDFATRAQKPVRPQVPTDWQCLQSLCQIQHLRIAVQRRARHQPQNSLFGVT